MHCTDRKRKKKDKSLRKRDRQTDGEKIKAKVLARGSRVMEHRKEKRKGLPAAGEEEERERGERRWRSEIAGQRARGKKAGKKYR